MCTVSYTSGADGCVTVRTLAFLGAEQVGFELFFFFFFFFGGGGGGGGGGGKCRDEPS